MYDFYNRKLSDSDLKRARKALKRLYEDIPETDGCMVNIEKEGGCGAWCCQHQSPSLFYSEFLYAWLHVEKWEKQKLVDLMLRCVENYLDRNPTKGCVFWDRETKMCGIHKNRPFNCRTYGQIPEEDFKPRYERLKVLYADDPFAVVKDQCHLVTSPKPPSKSQMDEWFKELQFIEKDIKIDQKLMNDGDGGSYRQFHDHIILQTCSPAVIDKLVSLRTRGTDRQRSTFLVDFRKDLEQGLGL